MDIVQIATHLIDEDTEQPRYQFDEEALQELMNSIDELGLLSPIKVRETAGGRYKIIYGNRRYKACKTLGRPAIPCIVSTVTNELDIYLEQIAENLTREGFSPIEEAEAFHKLLNDPKFSSSTKFLSSKLGKQESYIKNKCELLKFSNAVKKLIVSGTEIRKDKLTEDQLLPLKDLPMEHRDPLALIMARDEMPVSDVKKIAKLFKDSEITASTKDKLLYKSGPGLLETWYTIQHNKAEKAKQPAEVKPKPGSKPEASKPDTDKPDAVTTATDITATGKPESPVQMDIAITPPEPAKVPEVNSPFIAQQLQQLLAALPPHSALLPEALQSFQELSTEERQALLSGIDSLLVSLQSHLTEWNKIKSLTQTQ
ncbi:ParB/RepB/Spo0J family partition protein [Paenibacillus gorillae]|uniref:ParB/RepB/Spo0J family partition protein n=1 Tax=Paenibacillus gorillae TaxID=1243662 RepID=UPI0004B43601|nr:ParB/RepB/Spo0J family partition protein [Paenibacillus gorillae]